MGTKVHSESNLPGYFSMRDLNEDSSNWSIFYGDKALVNGPYGNSYFPRTVGNPYPREHKEALKQTMLEHEAVFKYQVFELHRLYGRQRDMMDEIKRRELQTHRVPMETSSSSSPLAFQVPHEDTRKWNKPNFPLANYGFARPSGSVAENISSPLSCTKRNSALGGLIPSPNGCISKDCEILAVRPSKVRKKLFDLELPADVYIHTEEGEQSPDYKISNISRNSPSKTPKISSESSVKLNFESVPKIDCNGDASRFGSCLMNSVGLADLNEPVLVEEATVSTSIDFMACAARHTEINDLDLGARPKSQFLLGLCNETLQDPQHGSNNVTSISPRVENKRIAREWPSYMYEAGHSKTHLNSFPRGLQPDKQLMSSQRTHTKVNEVHQALEILPSDYSSGDLWRERTVHGLGLSERRSDFCNSSHLQPVVASRIPNPSPLVHTSDSNNVCSHSISPWGKLNISFTQKLTSNPTLPRLDSSGTISRSSQASAQSQDFFIDKCHLNSSSGSNPVFGSDLANCNRFYHGSSSVSKDLPNLLSSAGFDYPQGNKHVMILPNGVDTKPVKDMNLNPCSSLCEDRKCDGNLDVFPWLKAKPANKEGTSSKRDSNSSGLSFLRTDSNHLSNKSENVNGTTTQHFTEKFSVPSCDYEVGDKRNESDDLRVNRKILGFPISDHLYSSRKESSSVGSSIASLCCPPQYEDIKNEGKVGVIDINLAYDPESGAQISAEVLVVEKESDEKVSNFRSHIDLNSSASEEEVTEVTLAPSLESSTGVQVKIAVDINLEIVPVPEFDEDILPQYNVENSHKESVRIAAEAIVAISSSCHLDCVEETASFPQCEAPSVDSLFLFAEIVCSYVDDLESKFGTKSRGEFDYFEAMTLNLIEIKEEEYMPKPSVVEMQNMEENESISPSVLQRRGQARRARLRRDFQRDILPGLASLSRHEVTEDLQTFGGLMRAMGHSWSSGLARRNGTRSGGAARGRRRPVFDTSPAVAEITVCTPLIHKLTSFEVGLVDRNLTGWGKTPRRPRRQRCPPAGNLPSIVLANCRNKCLI